MSLTDRDVMGQHSGVEWVGAVVRIIWGSLTLVAVQRLHVWKKNPSMRILHIKYIITSLEGCKQEYSAGQKKIPPKTNTSGWGGWCILSTVDATPTPATGCHIPCTYTLHIPRLVLCLHQWWPGLQEKKQCCKNKQSRDYVYVTAAAFCPIIVYIHVKITLFITYALNVHQYIETVWYTYN